MEEYRGVPFVAYADGIMNMTGISEGLLVLDTNNPATQPIIFEAGLLRPLQTRQRGERWRGWLVLLNYGSAYGMQGGRLGT